MKNDPAYNSYNRFQHLETSSENRVTLTVASYNVHRCIGQDGAHRPDRVAQVLKEMDADVIALQEIDTHLIVDGKGHQLDYLAREAGYQIIPGPTIQTDRGEYGNAMLTRLSPLAVRRLDLTEHDYEPRGAIDVDFELGGHPVRIIGLHLGLKHCERCIQTERFLHMIGKDHPRMVVMGDFNDWVPFSRVTRMLESHLGKAPRLRSYPTWSPFPFVPIDRIYVHPWKALKRISLHRSFLSKQASDHFPVKAFISWKEKEPIKGIF